MAWTIVWRWSYYFSFDLLKKVMEEEKRVDLKSDEWVLIIKNDAFIATIFLFSSYFIISFPLLVFYY